MNEPGEKYTHYTTRPAYTELLLNTGYVEKNSAQSIITRIFLILEKVQLSFFRDLLQRLNKKQSRQLSPRAKCFFVTIQKATELEMPFISVTARVRSVDNCTAERRE